MLTTIVSVLFVLVLVAGVPALSYSTGQSSEVRNLPRLDLYLSAVLSQWLLALVGLGAVYLIERKVFWSGFGAISWRLALGSACGIAVAALLVLGVVVWCERRGWLPPESDLVYMLIPETAREKVWAVLIISPTAAFCEEFLFRGFLLSQLHDWLHSLLWAWILCSVAFGLAHFYQGWSGMTRAGLLGVLLAYPVVRWGSLHPSMLAHWMIDTGALLVLGPRLARREKSGAVDSSGPSYAPPSDTGSSL